MVRSTRILSIILVLGIVYSFYRAFSGQGGSGLYDFFDALSYSSIALSVVAAILIVINFRDLKNHWPAIIFFLIGLPLTLTSIFDVIGEIEYNRAPDLSAKYDLPVTKEQFRFDSALVKAAIESRVQIKNDTYGGPDIIKVEIDTIIYSQKGDKIFVSFIEWVESNERRNELMPDFLGATKRDSLFWQLREVFIKWEETSMMRKL
jgi:hypothetical protein